MNRSTRLVAMACVVMLGACEPAPDAEGPVQQQPAVAKTPTGPGLAGGVHTPSAPRTLISISDTRVRPGPARPAPATSSPSEAESRLTGEAPRTPTPPPVSIPGISLAPAGECTEVLAQVKAKLVEDMTQKLEAQRKAMLGQVGAVDCDDPASWYWLYWDDEGMDYDCDSDGMSNLAESSGDPGGASEYSTTNNQVASVDEADFIKNNASFIYVLTEDRLAIIDAWPPETAQEIGSYPLEGQPRKLFVHNDRAFVYSAMGSQGGKPAIECTYGYDCDFTGDGLDTRVTVLDLKVPEAPKLVRQIDFGGSLIAARRIGDAVHTVVHFKGTQHFGLKTIPDEFGSLGYGWWGCEPEYTAEEVDALFDALLETNLAAIEALQWTDVGPAAVETSYTEGGEPTQTNLFVSDCDGFMLGSAPETRLMGLFSTDIGSPAGVASTVVLGRPGAVYASATGLYVATRENGPGGYQTLLHQFQLGQSPPHSDYVGSGTVKGWVLNQLSMDEHEGYLRIATTSGHAPNPKTHSTISVLENTAGLLEVVGQIDNIAPSEDIRSARFDGHRGFIVTFKKTDPLYAIDLSVPTAPFIAGELKIPGFSTYMHLMGDDHLLTIGYDADDQGSFAWFQGVMLQIFDVSEMSAPTLTHKEVIGTRGSTSEAATNHLAFNYFAQKDLLAIPMVICEGGGGGSYGYLATFNGLLVFDVTTETGFEELGGISHAEPETQVSWGGPCNNWWTKAGSTVRRSIIMDDYVFSVAPDAIKIDHLSALGAGLAEIPL